jgi:hypothetical protein
MSNLSQVRSYINDANGIFYVDAHVLDHINDCHLYTWWDTSPNLTTSTVTLTISQDLLTLPSAMMIPRYFEYDNKRYWASSQSELENDNLSWRGEPVAQPKWLIVFDAERLRLWPRPDQAYVIQLVGVGWPTELTTAAPDVTLERHYQQIIEHRAAGKLLTFIRPDLAEIHNKEADQHLNNYKIGIRNSQSHKIWRLKPASRFNTAQQGNITIGRRYG